MLELISLILRGVQAVLAIIVLGLTAYIADAWGNLDRNSFLLFVSLFTLLALGYLALIPKFAPSAAHPWALFGVDLLTTVFWFAGFIAEAVLRRDLGYYDWSSYYYIYNECYGNTCEVTAAAAGIGAIAWLTFVVTTAFSGLNAFKGRKRGGNAPATQQAPMTGV